MGDFFDEVDRMHKQDAARVQAQRDGTPLGDLKAEYLECLYQRRNCTLGLRILVQGNLPENFQKEKRDEIAALDLRMSDLAEKLDAAGIIIKKKVK